MPRRPHVGLHLQRLQRYGTTWLRNMWAVDEKAKILLENQKKWIEFRKEVYENQRIDKAKKSAEKKRKDEATAEEAEAKAQREAAEHRYKHPVHVNLEALEILTHTDTYCPEACGYHSYNK